MKHTILSESTNKYPNLRIIYSDAGFTLLEVMIALLILTIGIVTVLQVFPVAFNVVMSNQMETQATLLCQEKIEEIISKSYIDIITGTTTASLSSPFEKFSRETKISDIETGLKKVEVIVSWKSLLGTKQENVKLVTFVSKR